MWRWGWGGGGGVGGGVCGISRRSLVLVQHGGVSGAPGLSVAPSGGACAFFPPLLRDWASYDPVQLDEIQCFGRPAFAFFCFRTFGFGCLLAC